MNNISSLTDSESCDCDVLMNLAAKLPRYAVDLDLSTGEVASVAADASAFRWVLDCCARYKTSSQQWTAFKILLRDGPEGPSSAPKLPCFPLPPDPLPDYGIFPRIRRLVRRLKVNAAYTKAIGEDLGIAGNARSLALCCAVPESDCGQEGMAPETAENLPGSERTPTCARDEHPSQPPSFSPRSHFTLFGTATRKQAIS